MRTTSYKLEQNLIMGNRAVITNNTKDGEDYKNNVGIYVHWNGGRDSIEAFLTYCKLRGFREPDRHSYGTARLIQVIANFAGGDGLSVGVDICKNLDCNNYDNGVYFIEGWDITRREFEPEREQYNHNLREMLIDIDEAQPKDQQLGADTIRELLAVTAIEL